jgi:Arc/MetJ-type ribon-helix-helix transcriptional regulator
MSQISIRLPDEMVAYLDSEVNRHCASSRAALVRRAPERERRRQIAARDAEILAKVSSEDDMDSLATHVDNLSRDLA